MYFTSTKRPPNKTAGPSTKRSHIEQSTQNTIAASDTIGINLAIDGTNLFPQIKSPEVQSTPTNVILEDQEGASEKILK